MPSSNYVQPQGQFHGLSIITSISCRESYGMDSILETSSSITMSLSYLTIKNYKSPGLRARDINHYLSFQCLR